LFLVPFFTLTQQRLQKDLSLDAPYHALL